MYFLPYTITFPSNIPFPDDKCLKQKLLETSGLSVTITKQERNYQGRYWETLCISHPEFTQTVTLDRIHEKSIYKVHLSISIFYLRPIVTKCLLELGGESDRLIKFPDWISHKWTDETLPKFVRHLEELNDAEAKMLVKMFNAPDGESDDDYLKEMEQIERAFYKKYQ